MQYRNYDFYDDKIERQIRHGKINRSNIDELKGGNNNITTIEDQSVLIDRQPKKTNKSSSVKILKKVKLPYVVNDSNNDESKRPKNKTDWQILVSQTMKDNQMSLKQALQHIKANNLYNKK